MTKSDVYLSELFNELAKRIGKAVAEEHGLMNEPDVLSPQSIAQRLDCSVSEVRRHLQEAGIKTLKFGKRGYRVPREEFEKHLERWKNGGELWD